jgi:serine/threonine protein kinase
MRPKPRFSRPLLHFTEIRVMVFLIIHPFVPSLLFFNYDENAGVILWEILTGQAPWEGMHPMQVVGAVGFQGCSLPLDFPPDTDEYLAELCARCLSKSPSNRPTFPEIVRELEARYNARLELGMHSKLSESRSSIGLSSDAGSDSNERLLLPPPPWAAMASQDDRPTDAHADTSYGTPGGEKDQVPDASPFANLAAQPFSSDTPLGGLPPFSQQPSTMETIRAQPDSAPTDQENNNNNPELGHCVRLSDASDGTLGHGFRLAGLEGSTSLPEGPTLEDVDDAGLRWTVNSKKDTRGDVELLSAALDSAQL